MTTGKAKYTVEEAASMLAKETVERESELFSRLDAAVLSGALPTYPRGSQLKINYGAQSTHQRWMQPRGYQEYVFWYDLNKWLDENFQQVSYKFPNPAAPETAPVPTPTPEKRKAKRKTIKSVAWDYLVKEFKNGQYSTAKEFYRGLERKSGKDDSPFEKGTGSHAGSLFVRDISKPMALKTLENNLPGIRAESRLT